MTVVQAHFLPQLVSENQLAGSVCVVIDVLRASTTIVHALAAGAREVIPCLEIDEARQLAAKFPAGQAVLAGERGGTAIEGFDLGNSPGEYTTQSVGGKTVIITTTNGTRALARCRRASQVLIAAFANLSAVCLELAPADRIDLVCAGTAGEITREDVLLAGAIIDRLQASRERDLNDEGALAHGAWIALQAADNLDRLTAALRASRGGRNLIELGYERDIMTAVQIDRFSIVPRLEFDTGRITGRII